MTSETLPTIPLLGRCFDLEITAEERAAINNDGVCLSLLSYFRTRDLAQRRPGGFVKACLTNDFLGAMNNRGVSWEAVDAIREILNRCPTFAFGSVYAFQSWTRPRSSWEIESTEQFSGAVR